MPIITDGFRQLLNCISIKEFLFLIKNFTLIICVENIMSDENEKDFSGTIKKLFADVDPDNTYISNTLLKDPTKTQEEAVIEIYRKMRPGEPTVLDNAQELFKNLFFMHI